VHGLPEAPGHAPHRERCQLYREQHVEGDDSPRDRARLPAGRERDEEVRDAEAGIAVRDETGEVDADERQREPPEETVDVEQPRWPWA